jgi:hypothetical protein
MMLKHCFKYCSRPLLFDRVCSGHTPLYKAAENGKVDACNILAKNGADVNAKDGE